MKRLEELVDENFPHFDDERLQAMYRVLKEKLSGFEPIVPIERKLILYYLSQIEQRAIEDPLTRLPNRRVFMHRLEDARQRAKRQSKTHTAVLKVDLNHFKRYNDRYGHEAADHLLVRTADYLSTSLREGDHLARIGGDEFAALLYRLPKHDDQSLLLLNRIVTGYLGERNGSQGNEEPQAPIDPTSTVTLAAGATFLAHEQSYEDSLKRADDACYHSKLVGKLGTPACAQLWSPDLDYANIREKAGKLR